MHTGYGQALMVIGGGWAVAIGATWLIAYYGGTLEAWAQTMTRLLAAMGVLG